MPGSVAEHGAAFGNPLLFGMQEVALPAAVPWWPIAPGWKLLAVLVCAALAWLAWREARRWRRNRYRRRALAELDAAVARARCWQEGVSALPALLKAVALHAYPREQVAALSGPAWFEFLDRSCTRSTFAGAAARCLGEASYVAPAAWSFGEAEGRALIIEARAWIRHHAECPGRA